MNKYIRRLLLIVLVVTNALKGFTQTQINNSKVYDPNIKTVELRIPNDLFAPPVLVLGSANSQLTCGFDDLKGSIHRYEYTVIHCNADWTQSRLWPNEYINGITEDRINDAKPSFGPRVPYTHYTFQFPTSSMQFTRSGNYLLKVFEENNPANICFTFRFYVVEPMAAIAGTVTKSSSVEQRDAMQEVDFQVTTNNNLLDPRSNVTAYIIQNGREDNSLKLKPKQVIGSILDFNYDTGENNFPAGNEFRRFNLSSVRNAMDHVSSISVIGDTYNAILVADIPRAFKNYISENDVNGNFLPNNIDYQNANTESEYVNVKFFLALSIPVSRGQIIATGRFCQWDPASGFIMKYTPSLKGYVGEGLLKQGYYDYMYLYYPEPNKPGLTSLVEGDYSETQNEYQLFIYYHKPGEVYDRLIGTGVIGKTKGN
jgi:hypothetical protein